MQVHSFFIKELHDRYKTFIRRKQTQKKFNKINYIINNKVKGKMLVSHDSSSESDDEGTWSE